MNQTMYVPARSLPVFATSASGQATITRPDGGKLTPAQIDSTVNSLIQAAHVTGAGVALFHHGEIVYRRGDGIGHPPHRGIDYPEALMNRGRAYERAGDRDAAMQDFKRATELAPNRAVALKDRMKIPGESSQVWR